MCNNFMHRDMWRKADGEYRNKGNRGGKLLRGLSMLKGIAAARQETLWLLKNG